MVHGETASTRREARREKNNLWSQELRVSFPCNLEVITKTSARVSSGVPNTKKQMKAQGRRKSAFIVSRCSEPLMKPEAQAFEMTSQTKQ